MRRWKRTFLGIDNAWAEAFESLKVAQVDGLAEAPDGTPLLSGTAGLTMHWPTWLTGLRYPVAAPAAIRIKPTGQNYLRLGSRLDAVASRVEAAVKMN